MIRRIIWNKIKTFTANFWTLLGQLPRKSLPKLALSDLRFYVLCSAYKLSWLHFASLWLEWPDQGRHPCFGCPVDSLRRSQVGKTHRHFDTFSRTSSSFFERKRWRDTCRKVKRSVFKDRACLSAKTQHVFSQFFGSCLCFESQAMVAAKTLGCDKQCWVAMATDALDAHLLKVARGWYELAHLQWFAQTLGCLTYWRTWDRRSQPRKTLNVSGKL
jgi:hypothetical protein